MSGKRPHWREQSRVNARRTRPEVITGAQSHQYSRSAVVFPGTLRLIQHLLDADLENAPARLWPLDFVAL